MAFDEEGLAARSVLVDRHRVARRGVRAAIVVDARIGPIRPVAARSTGPQTRPVRSFHGLKTRRQRRHSAAAIRSARMFVCIIFSAASASVASIWATASGATMNEKWRT